MRPSEPYFFPLAGPFVVAFFFFTALLIGLLQLGAIEYAYEKIGLGQQYVLGLLVLSLLGSYVNIPVARLTSERLVPHREVSVFGMRYVIPVAEEWPGTVIAVNLGGAVLPMLLSLYLVARNGVYVESVVGASGLWRRSP